MKLHESIADLIGKKLEIELPGTKTTLTVVDWEALTARTTELVKQAQQLPKAKRGDFYSHNPDRRSEIFEYFLDEDSEDEVEKGRWIPFGVLGLCHSPDSFAETGHAGLLVLEPARGKTPKVLWVHDEEAEVVAESLDQLKIHPVAEAVKAGKIERHLQPPYKALWDASLAKSMKDDYPGALQDLQNLVTQLPDEPAVHRALSQVHDLMKQGEQALAAIEQALRYSQEPLYLLSKVELLLGLRRHPEAAATLKTLEGATLKESDQAKRLVFEGICRYHAGDRKQAAALVRQGLAIDDMLFLSEELEKICEELKG